MVYSKENISITLRALSLAMSAYDQNNFEEEFEVPPLEDDSSLPEITQHLSLVSDAIDKCEKIMQHLAVGNFSDEFQHYMAAHIGLINQRNSLVEKMRAMQGAEQNTNSTNSKRPS